jgi:hypothetical protein
MLDGRKRMATSSRAILSGRIAAATRWNPLDPRIDLWRSELALTHIREEVARKLLAADRRRLGRELLGIGEDGGGAGS